MLGGSAQNDDTRDFVVSRDNVDRLVRRRMESSIRQLVDDRNSERCCLISVNVQVVQSLDGDDLWFVPVDGVEYQQNGVGKCLGKVRDRNLDRDKLRRSHVQNDGELVGRPRFRDHRGPLRFRHTESRNRSDFKRADIDRASSNSCLAALVGRYAAGNLSVRASVDRGTSRKQGMSLCWATVVGQRRQVGIGGRGNRTGEPRRRFDQVANTTGRVGSRIDRFADKVVGAAD